MSWLTALGALLSKILDLIGDYGSRRDERARQDRADAGAHNTIVADQVREEQRRTDNARKTAESAADAARARWDRWLLDDPGAGASGSSGVEEGS